MAEGWKRYAACKGESPTLFYWVEDIHTLEGRELAREAEATALAFCAVCSVRAACLEYADTHREYLGVWGGKTALQRRKERRAARAPQFRLLLR